MNDEGKIICPECKGYRCVWLRFSDINNFVICNEYYRNKKCLESNSRCHSKCHVCKGVGEITWIDSLFEKDPPIPDYDFREFVKFLSSRNLPVNISDEEIFKMFKITGKSTDDFYGEIDEITFKEELQYLTKRNAEYKRFMNTVEKD